jgi:hypothetical protein
MVFSKLIKKNKFLNLKFIKKIKDAKKQVFKVYLIDLILQLKENKMKIIHKKFAFCLIFDLFC